MCRSLSVSALFSEGVPAPVAVLQGLQDWTSYNTAVDRSDSKKKDGEPKSPTVPTSADTLTPPAKKVVEKAGEKSTPFHSTSVPGISVLEYGARLARHGRLADDVIICGVVLVYRYAMATGIRVTQLNIHRLLAVGTVLSVKMNCEYFYDNKHFAQVAGVCVNELCALELEMMDAIKADAWVSSAEIDRLSAFATKAAVNAEAMPSMEAVLERGATLNAAIHTLVIASADWVLPSPDAASSSASSESSSVVDEDESQDFEDITVSPEASVESGADAAASPRSAAVSGGQGTPVPGSLNTSVVSEAATAAAPAFRGADIAATSSVSTQPGSIGGVSALAREQLTSTFEVPLKMPAFNASVDVESPQSGGSDQQISSCGGSMQGHNPQMVGDLMAVSPQVAQCA